MGYSKITKVPDATSTVPQYRKIGTSGVEFKPRKYVSGELWTEFLHSGTTAKLRGSSAILAVRRKRTRISRQRKQGALQPNEPSFETQSGEKRRREGRITKSLEMAPPRLTISDLATVKLWKIIRSERPVAIRAKALAELMRRENEHGELASFVVEELAKDDLKPTWRNTLIFATEHLDFLDAAQRQQLRDLLGGLVTALRGQWHSRSRLAQEAALRRYGSLIDDKVELGGMVRFLSTDYSFRVRLIALQTIQNAFAAAPPSVSLQEDLGGLREELQQMAGFFFRPQVLARSEEDFDLGLTAIEALIRLGDPTVSQFVPRAKEIGASWVARQLAQFFSETLAAWPEADSASSTGPARVVSDAFDVLQAIESQPG
ncbi:MAG: hypothetical protein HQ581_26525 [Planctomycetes bacterium]|nr:hypothetical protein [Planctomycetota bacterium]